MKAVSLLAALILPLAAHSAISTITPGDAAFVAYNADEDGFALVSFVDLAAGSVFHVTDNEWSTTLAGGGSGFSTGEGDLAWTLDADLTAGTIVRFSAVNSYSGVAVSHGVVSMSDRLQLRLEDESLYLYLDAPGAPIALAAFGIGDGFAAELAGSGLEANAVALSGRADFAQYVGPRSGKGDLAEYRADILDAAQWAVRSGTDEAATRPDMTAFTVSNAVPEPATLALMMTGWSALALSRRTQK